MVGESLVDEGKRQNGQQNAREATQCQTTEGTTIIREIQSKPKDWWDKLHILAALMVPIIVPIVGWIASNAITESQLESSKRIAQSQLTKDYISMLTQAMGKEDDKDLIAVLDSIAGLDDIPPGVRGILARISRESRSQRVLQAASRLTSPEDRKKLEKYFGSEN